MKSVYAAIVGAVIAATGVSAAVTPALALGGCGPNYHRNPWGRCVWGGQNQAWCLRHKGYTATQMPDGTMHCF